MKRSIIVCSVLILLVSSVAQAKKNKEPKPDKQALSTNAALPVNSATWRVAHLTAEDQRLFDSLSAEQRDKISKGQIDIGFNAWMVKLALGEPMYGTEHHPIYTDFEEVWLYSKPEVTKDVKENKIIDTQTNWPTIHRITTSKKCNVDDFFVLWDRGVVAAINKSKNHNINGTCTVEHEEAFLPIVNGKPVEPK